jgi:hypothetical protein
VADRALNPISLWGSRNSAAALDLAFYAARSYSLMRPPITVEKLPRAQRGLSLNEDKTRIVHLAQGFDFLGWNIRRYPNGKQILIVDHLIRPWLCFRAATAPPIPYLG